MSRFERVSTENVDSKDSNNNNEHDGFWVRVGDGKDVVELFCKLWKADRPKAVVTFIHGLGEHILRYDAHFQKFASAGIQVFGFDQRGFGRTVLHRNGAVGSAQSVATKGPAMVLGDSQGWSVAQQDILDAYLFSHIDGVPHFIFGHSMGGLLALGFAIENGRNVPGLTGVIASAPALRPGFPVPYLKRVVGSFVARFLGSMNIPTDLDVNAISRDEAVVAAYKSDPYVHGMGSLRLLSSLLQKGEWILCEGYKSYNESWPLLMPFGTMDKLTSYAAGQQFFDKVACKDKTFRSWEGLFHELHNEPEKEEVLKEYIDWILSHSQTS